MAQSQVGRRCGVTGAKVGAWPDPLGAGHRPCPGSTTSAATVVHNGRNLPLAGIAAGGPNRNRRHQRLIPASPGRAPPPASGTTFRHRSRAKPVGLPPVCRLSCWQDKNDTDLPSSAAEPSEGAMPPWPARSATRDHHSDRHPSERQERGPARTASENPTARASPRLQIAPNTPDGLPKAPVGTVEGRSPRPPIGAGLSRRSAVSVGG